MSGYPRVLHVGFNPIGGATNTGLTLASMFADWPEESLFELYTAGRVPLSGSVNSLVAPARIAPVDAALRPLIGGRFQPVTDGLNHSTRGRPATLTWRQRARSAGSTMNEIGPVMTRGAWLDPVRAFRPQVIHSLLGGVRIMKITASLSARLGLPIVPHFMDDWPATMFAGEEMAGLPRRQVERWLARVMRRAPLCLTIGEDMRVEFQERFGVSCVAVGNSVDFDAYASLVNRRPPSEARRLVYMGGLHLGRDRILAAVAGALARLGPSGGARLVLHVPPVDSGRQAALVEEFPGVVEAGGSVPPDQVPQQVREADVLVFVESFQPEILGFTRLSVSTKVPEYLAARRPVLAVGPAGQSSIRALVASGAAGHAADLAPETLDDAVRSSLAMVGRPLRPLTPALISTFDHRATRQRLRESMVRAAAGR